MRVSRPCYDKYHRCPGWAGGGIHSAKVERCDGGSLAATGYYGKRAWKWRCHRCPKCRVIILPYMIRWLDWEYVVKWAAPRWLEKFGRVLGRLY